MKYKNVNIITPNIRNNETGSDNNDNDNHNNDYYSNNEFIVIIPIKKNTFLNTCMINLKNFEVLFSLTVFSLTSCRI